MKKPLIIVAIVVSSLIILAIVFYSFFWYGNISTDSGSISITNSDTPSSNKIKLRPGNYTVTLYDPLKNPETKNITVKPFESLKLTNPNTDLSPLEIIKNNYQAPQNFIINSADIYSKNTWIVAEILNIDKNKDGYVLIFRYTDNNWQFYNAGSGLADTTLKKDNIEVYNVLTSNDSL